MGKTEKGEKKQKVGNSLEHPRAVTPASPSGSCTPSGGARPVSSCSSAAAVLLGGSRSRGCRTPLELPPGA